MVIRKQIDSGVLCLKLYEVLTVKHVVYVRTGTHETGEFLIHGFWPPFILVNSNTSA